MITKKPFLSIIIPVYNEGKRLNKLSRFYQFFNKQKFGYEIIIVSDGSTDNTLGRLSVLLKKFKFKLITYEQNHGKGFAIKTGMAAAEGKYLLFSDIDLSTPIEEFDKFLPFFKKNTIIIGSRKAVGSMLYKRQGFIRESLGKGFTLLSRVVLNLQISDFTCGFKCFPKRAKKIFAVQKIARWSFDSEILFLAKKYGYKIKEVPVTWSNAPGTKVKFPQDIITSFMDLYRIRFRNHYPLK